MLYKEANSRPKGNLITLKQGGISCDARTNGNIWHNIRINMSESMVGLFDKKNLNLWARLVAMAQFFFKNIKAYNMSVINHV